VFRLSYARICSHCYFEHLEPGDVLRKQSRDTAFVTVGKFAT
jgi:hypothetical protein